MGELPKFLARQVLAKPKVSLAEDDRCQLTASPSAD